MKLFAAGQKMCAERGLILVDTKYEFGKTKDGKIIVIDEIHTPDSSRFWMMDTLRGALRRGAKTPSRSTRTSCGARYIAMGYSGDGPPPPLPDDVRVGRRAALHRGVRAHHGQGVRAEHRSAARAHGAQPHISNGVGMKRSTNIASVKIAMALRLTSSGAAPVGG